MMKKDAKVSISKSLCSEPDCDRARSFASMTRRCRIHDVIESAKLMTADELAFVIEKITAVVPLTDEQRHEREIKSRLRLVAMYAEQRTRAVNLAIDAGATADQIADASA